ncbi:MAG: NAD(P)-dependent oxidoreductase [Chloroflexia bacterium]
MTGAGGTLGTALAPMLAAAGHDPVLFDIEPIRGEYESIQGDVRNAGNVQAAVSGAELVIHTAAIHGIHLGDHSSREFYDLNLTGTFNVWEASAQAGVKGVVFSSTMGVYGESRKPPRDDAVVELREDLPLLPGDIYGYTKVAGEEMCRYYGRTHGIPSVALRFGMFVPEPFFRYGIRLLYGGVDTSDVAGAVVACIDPLVKGKLRWDTFNVESSVPFTEADGPLLRQDPLLVLDKYYPGAEDLLRERGVEGFAPIREYFPMKHAATVLGFKPLCNFKQWLKELRTRPQEKADKSPPWP